MSAVSWRWVARTEELTPGKAKIVKVDNREIGIFREQNNYYAVLNVCPHFHAEICKGRITGTLIAEDPDTLRMRHDLLVLRCPWHHWEFDIKTGKAIIPSIKQKLKVYEVKEENGDIYINV